MAGHAPASTTAGPFGPAYAAVYGAPAQAQKKSNLNPRAASFAPAPASVSSRPGSSAYDADDEKELPAPALPPVLSALSLTSDGGVELANSARLGLVEEIPARDKSAEQGKRKKKNGGMGKMLLTQVERARKRREMKGIPHPVEQVEFSYLFELEKKSRQIS